MGRLPLLNLPQLCLCRGAPEHWVLQWPLQGPSEEEGGAICCVREEFRQKFQIAANPLIHLFIQHIFIEHHSMTVMGVGGSFHWAAVAKRLLCTHASGWGLRVGKNGPCLCSPRTEMGK